VQIIKASAPVVKSNKSEQLTTSKTSDGIWLTAPIPRTGLRALVNNSSILPQCIRAYKNNIAGFGLGVRYKEDAPGESDEMIAEYERAEDILELLNLDMDTKEVFEDLIEARETYGCAFLEIIRNLAGEVVGIEFLRNTPTVEKSIPLEPSIEAEHVYKGQILTRPKLFCKYRQTVNGNTVYFKELGDPRVMDKRTGKYAAEVAGEWQANEILEFAIGTEPYGEVHWIGQILGVDGSRKAEELNNRYFSEGRHTPLMIVIKGGQLKPESFEKLQHYMDDIKGANGQHAFMLLEAENVDSRADFEGEKQPEIEIHDLASILQKDELFQEYLSNGRRRVQSAFQLPDIYVGYTTDFNRATAQAALEVTEEQVFQPERKSLAWAVNNKLLADYHFQHVEAYFKAPEIGNPEDIMRILNVTERAGGLTPNLAKDITFGALGRSAEDYQEDWGNTPLAVLKAQGTSPAQNPALLTQLTKQIQKAAYGDNAEIVAVMKEVRALIQSAQ
jgi:PBSX family phage portal protein